MSILFNIKKKDISKKNLCMVCSYHKLKLISQVYYKNEFIFFSTAMCQKCGFIFRNIHPSDKWFLHQFKKRSKFQKNKNLGINKYYEKLRIKRYNYLYNFLNSKIKFNNVLDIGCATGLGLKIFKKRNHHITGIDTDKTRIDYGVKYGFNLFNKSIFSYKSKKKFDLIIFLHTLEHLTDPTKALNKIKSLMHKNSYLYVEVPNFKNLVRTWDDSIYLSHISNFSEKNLIFFLKKNGFKILYQTFPQTENGEYNLGILCQKNEIKKIKYNEFHIPSLSKYLINGKKKKLKIDYKITLDEINDLSYAQKLKKRINSKLNDNFGRLLKFDRIYKKYILDSKIYIFKEKKNKFLNRLKYKKNNY